MRPNIVVVVADDHGREAVGCYGNPAVSTPAIDALAADGVRFDNAFCTTASCSASRSVLLTGLHNHTNGTYGLTHPPHGFSMAPGVATLPALLSEAGYRTGRIGKKHYRPERAATWGLHLLEAVVEVPAAAVKRRRSSNFAVAARRSRPAR